MTSLDLTEFQRCSLSTGVPIIAGIRNDLGRKQLLAHRVDANIHAGVKYMRFMVDQFFANEPMDKINKALFAFASMPLSLLTSSVNNESWQKGDLILRPKISRSPSIRIE